MQPSPSKKIHVEEKSEKQVSEPEKCEQTAEQLREQIEIVEKYLLRQKLDAERARGVPVVKNLRGEAQKIHPDGEFLESPENRKK